VRGRPGQGTFVIRSLPGIDPAVQGRFLAAMTDLLRSARSAPRRDARALPASWEVIEESHTDKQSVPLVRTEDPILDPAWTVRPVSLEDVLLAYMSQSADATRARRPELEVAS
jgi:hypothetical protein